MCIIEANLDADLLVIAVLMVGNTALPKGALCVPAAALETNVSHTCVLLGTGGGVCSRAALWCPDAAMLGVWASITGDPGEAIWTGAGRLILYWSALCIRSAGSSDVTGVVVICWAVKIGGCRGDSNSLLWLAARGGCCSHPGPRTTDGDGVSVVIVIIFKVIKVHCDCWICWPGPN